MPVLDRRSPVEKTLPPNVDGSGLRISFVADLDERLFLATGRTFLPDAARWFNRFAWAVTVLRAAFFFTLLLLRVFLRRLLFAMLKMYHL